MDSNKPKQVFGIIGGSGVYDIEGLSNKRWVRVDSSFGEPSDELMLGELNGQAITFEAYTAALAEYTPEYVEKLSGVPAADIRMLAGLFGDRKKRITSLWCMGMNQHTRGTAMNTLVHGLHLLSVGDVADRHPRFRRACQHDDVAPFLAKARRRRGAAARPARSGCRG